MAIKLRFVKRKSEEIAMAMKGLPAKRAKKEMNSELYKPIILLLTAELMNIAFDGPFRTNIGLFVKRYGWGMPMPMPESFLVMWRVVVEVGNAEIAMHVVEEDVCRSPSVCCEDCRVAGWGNHPVCGKRYHFIIKNDGSPQSSHQSCPMCEKLLHSLELKCSSCDYMITIRDVEYRTYLRLHDSTHLLHGVIHANGYGHLLRVNGREGGSQSLTGTDTLTFWDRLCTMLQVREVTVKDVSEKYGMEYRLLHTIIFGYPWYGKWGYEFGRGSFALTPKDYNEAINNLSSIPLSLFYQARAPQNGLQNTIALYRSLATHKLEIVRDLFRFIMQLLHNADEEQKTRNTSLCAWSEEDVDRAEVAVVKVLRAIHGSQWVSWKTLNGTTCRTVGSAELLGFCLKRLGGRTTDEGKVVTVRSNQESNSLEYRLETASDNTQSLCKLSRDHLVRDLKFLYDALLNPVMMQDYRPKLRRKLALNSAKKLLDCSQFIKQYDLAKKPRLSTIQILCKIRLEQYENIIPPPELLLLPTDATVSSLLREAAKAFQETYPIFQNFEAEKIQGFENGSHSTPVEFLIGQKGTIEVRGRCLQIDEKIEHLRMEKGMETWVINCVCGAKDDDGERMLACDSCGVWQHTRCNGIGDNHDVPETFLCVKCTIFRSARRGNGIKRKRYKQSITP